MAFIENEPTENTEGKIVSLKEDHAFMFGTFTKGHKFKVLFYSPDNSYAQVIDNEAEEGNPAHQLYLATSLLKGAKQADPAPKAVPPSPAAAPAPVEPLPESKTIKN